MILAAAVCLLLLFLYWRGMVPISVKYARMYLGTGSWGSQCVGASFTDCHGSVRRILRLRESRSYSFQLTGHISCGTVAVQIYEGKTCVLTLTADQPSGILSGKGGQGYTVVVRFQNASGDYQLAWS